MMSLPAHIFALWRAETIKLLSRTSARLGLLAAIVVGLVIPLILFPLGRWLVRARGDEVGSRSTCAGES